MKKGNRDRTAGDNSPSRQGSKETKVNSERKTSLGWRKKAPPPKAVTLADLAHSIPRGSGGCKGPKESPTDTTTSTKIGRQTKMEKTQQRSVEMELSDAAPGPSGKEPRDQEEESSLSECELTCLQNHMT